MTLADGAARLAELLDQLPHGYLGFDAAGRCTHANAVAAQLLGQDAAALQRQDLLALFGQAAGSPLDGVRQRVLHAGLPATVELPSPRGGGRLALRLARAGDGLAIHLHTLDAAAGGAVTDELRYRLAMSTGDLWDVDFGTGRSMISPRIKRTLGYEPHELPDTAQTWVSLIHPDDLPGVVDAMRRHLRQGAPYDVQYRVRSRSGGWRRVQARGQASWDGARRATYMAGSVTDVTALWEAEQRAERLADFYSALSRMNGAIVRLHDAQALFEEVCRICVEHGHALIAYVMLRKGDGMEAMAWAGPAEQFLKDIPRSLDRSTALGSGPVATAILEGRHYVANDLQADPRTLPWREHAARIRSRATAAFPIRRGGAVIGAFSLHSETAGFFDERMVALIDRMATDLSFALDNADREQRRQQAEAQARADFERFAKVFHGAPLPASISALSDGRLLDVNEAYVDLFGLPREQLVGRTTIELGIWQAAGREAFVALIGTAGQVRDLEVAMPTRHGDTRTVLINAQIIDFAGQPSLLTLLNDVTEQRRAEETERARRSAEAASRAKTEFLSRMSHELRTPLNAVLGFSQLLGMDGAEPLSSRQRMQVEQIRHAGWHLLALVDDVLDVARIESGAMQLDPVAVDVAALVAEVIGLSTSLALQHQVGLAVEPGEPVPAAWADRIRLRQVLLNLVSNAVKYNRPGGSVHVGLRRDGEGLRITLRDDGIGMDAHQLAHLFEPFNRLGRERGAVAGTGIGLVVTRDLVHLMQGRIDVDSAPGRGTVVTVWLPTREAVADAAPPVSADLPLPAGEPHGTVLYVEDNPVNRLVVEQLLSRWSQVRLLQAEDGGEGLALARQHRPDLVLLDMRLPDLDGRAVLRALRADPVTRALRVVVLSAGAMPDEIAQARAAGAADYWTKPIDVEKFLAGMRRQLPAG